MINLSRDENGLLSGATYQYDEQGRIDWRKMIQPEFLVPNKQSFEKFGKEVPTSIEGLQDNQLLILLGGIKQLASLRGFSSVDYVVTSPSQDFVVAKCSIVWIPNFETENRVITFSAIADASPQNTTDFGRLYLGPIAENRAFVRCVRNFLRINIVGQDEIAPSRKEEDKSPSGPASLLDKLMQEKNISFGDLQKKLIEEGDELAKDYVVTSDIPKLKIFELIERIKKKK